MPEITEQRRYYDERWAPFDYPDELELARVSVILQMMRRVGHYRKVCDLGCGSGWIAGILGHFATALGMLRLQRVWHDAALRSDFGLHLAVVAQKPSA